MPGDDRNFDPVDVNRGMPACGAKHAIRTHLAPIDVRFGSEADVGVRSRDVRFRRANGRRWPENGHRSPEVRYWGQIGRPRC